MGQGCESSGKGVSKADTLAGEVAEKEEEGWR